MDYSLPKSISPSAVMTKRASSVRNGDDSEMTISTILGETNILKSAHSQTETKHKLNFSVDRLLSNDCVKVDTNIYSYPHHPHFPSYPQHHQEHLINRKIFNSKLSHFQHQQQAHLTNNNCQDCIVPGVRCSRMECRSGSGSGSGSTDMLVKTIVRPMPIRIGRDQRGIHQHLQTSSNLPLIRFSHQQLYSPNYGQTAFGKSPHLLHQNTPPSSHHPLRSSITTMETPSTTTNNNVNNNSSNTNTSNGKRKRSWSRAVFSNLQRKGLEIAFKGQKYITKPDRRKLAARLGLTDAQVKVWFQNRRMKWRHTGEDKRSGEKTTNSSTTPAVNHEICVKEEEDVFSNDDDNDDDDDDDDEIDVVSE